MKTLFLGLFVTLFVSMVLASDFIPKRNGEVDGCVTGVYKHPQSPYAVTLFCEDALGAYLSVTYLGAMGAPNTNNQKWSLHDRHWQDGGWGDDVTGFEWLAGGTRLKVSTSAIYGSGGYFELDLNARDVKQLLPLDHKVSTSDPGPGYSISGRENEP